ncbi:hypothetical protein N8J89_25285 [Crossiella sp. CA-258035]|uniref:rhamnogalacturonan endolyase family protein n=1 Tax=Crossiella sp. CA-258035 TaxID=2981138 RepID=UPI0024BCAE55|nr:hypothetical protein [Crossiella sp. CA-258035]WHT16442.1 hypothetical protein N8J89_25285 [Crossiella sp. CA-258035]
MGSRRLAVHAAALAVALLLPATAAAGPGPGRPRLEQLDRGLVAATTDRGVQLSWRLLGEEVTGATATGMAGPEFAVYRDGTRLATVSASTTYLDPAARPGARYRVAPLVRGVPLRWSKPVTAWAASFHDLPLRKPADGVTPAGRATPTWPTT